MRILFCNSWTQKYIWECYNIVWEMTTNGKVKVSISFTTDNNMTDFEIHSFSICFHVISIIQCKVGKLLACVPWCFGEAKEPGEKGKQSEGSFIKKGNIVYPYLLLHPNKIWKFSSCSMEPIYLPWISITINEGFYRLAWPVLVTSMVLMPWFSMDCYHLSLNKCQLS